MLFRTHRAPRLAAGCELRLFLLLISVLSWGACSVASEGNPFSDGLGQGARASRQVDGSTSIELSLANGARLTIPEGAVDGTTRVELARMSDEGASRLLERVAPVVRPMGAPHVLTPHGTQFARPLQLTLPVSVGTPSRGQLKLLWLKNEFDRAWKKLADVDTDAGFVTTQLDHFSVVMLAEIAPGVELEGVAHMGDAGGDPPGDAANIVDGSTQDTPTFDAALFDAALFDAATFDAAARDSAVFDSAVSDAGTPDASAPEASTLDGASQDTSVPAHDASSLEASADTGWSEPNGPWNGVLVFEQGRSPVDFIERPHTVRLVSAEVGAPIEPPVSTTTSGDGRFSLLPPDGRQYWVHAIGNGPTNDDQSTYDSLTLWAPRSGDVLVRIGYIGNAQLPEITGGYFSVADRVAVQGAVYRVDGTGKRIGGVGCAKIYLDDLPSPATSAAQRYHDGPLPGRLSQQDRTQRTGKWHFGNVTPGVHTFRASMDEGSSFVAEKTVYIPFARHDAVAPFKWVVFNMGLDVSGPDPTPATCPADP